MCVWCMYACRYVCVYVCMVLFVCLHVYVQAIVNQKWMHKDIRSNRAAFNLRYVAGVKDWMSLTYWKHSIAKQNQGHRHHVNRIHCRKIVSCTPDFRFPRPQFQHAFIDHGHTEQQLPDIYTNPNHMYNTVWIDTSNDCTTITPLSMVVQKCPRPHCTFNLCCLNVGGVKCQLSKANRSAKIKPQAPRPCYEIPTAVEGPQKTHQFGWGCGHQMILPLRMT